MLLDIIQRLKATSPISQHFVRSQSSYRSPHERRTRCLVRRRLIYVLEGVCGGLHDDILW